MPAAKRGHRRGRLPADLQPETKQHRVDVIAALPELLHLVAGLERHRAVHAPREIDSQETVRRDHVLEASGRAWASAASRSRSVGAKEKRSTSRRAATTRPTSEPRVSRRSHGVAVNRWPLIRCRCETQVCSGSGARSAVRRRSAPIRRDELGCSERLDWRQMPASTVASRPRCSSVRAARSRSSSAASPAACAP